MFQVLPLVAQSCPTLCDPMTPPGSSVHGILQPRILEWVAMPFSRGSSLFKVKNLGLPHCSQILYHLRRQGSPSVYQAYRNLALQSGTHCACSLSLSLSLQHFGIENFN